MKRIILGAALLAFSTVSFAGTTVKCNTPWGTQVFDPIDVDVANTTRDGTRVFLTNGKEIQFSPSIQCIITKE